MAIDPNRPCGQCESCVQGQTHFCLVEGPRRAYGVQQHGGCAEWVVVPEDVVYPLDERLPLGKAVLIEPISCIIRGMDNLGVVAPDKRVLIQGAGIIGLLWLSILHHKGLRHLTISDIAEGRRKVATELSLSPPINVVDAASLIGMHEEYDVVVDCSGNVGAIENAFQLLKRGGKLSVFSCCPTDAKVIFSPYELYRKELMIVSSFINPRTFARSIEMVAEMIDSGYLDIIKLGIGLFGLEDLKLVLERLKKGEISKAVFHL